MRGTNCAEDMVTHACSHALGLDDAIHQAMLNLGTANLESEEGVSCKSRAACHECSALLTQMHALRW